MSSLDAHILAMRIEEINEPNPCTEFGPAARAKLGALEAAVLYILRQGLRGD